MGNKHGTLTDFPYSLFKPIHPFGTNRLIPFSLLNTHQFRVPGFPKRLPMGIIRVADSRNNESRDIHERDTFWYF